MRMFVAVRPPASVLEDLDEFLEPRRGAGQDLRWTRPEQWHLTLAFLPTVHEDRLDELADRLGEVSARQAPFPLRVAGGGTFPDPAAARVLWMGVPEESRTTLARLAAGARSAASVSGAPVDGARFHPHVTVARVPRAMEATRWLRVLTPYGGPSWTVEDVALVESHPGEGRHHRTRHEVREVFPLTGSAPERSASRAPSA